MKKKPLIITCVLLAAAIALSAAVFGFGLGKKKGDEQPKADPNAAAAYQALSTTADFADHPLLPTDFDGIFYSADPNGNFEFYEYKNGAFTKIDASGTVTATVTPRYFSPFVLPTWTSRNHQLRTAVRVQDALAALSPTAPTATTRVDATRAELIKGWVSTTVICMVTALVVLCLIMGLFTQWDVGDIAFFLGCIVVATGVSAWFSVRAQRPATAPTTIPLPQ